ncbi:hypothetical protein NLU13_9576 [Sarocladium strictum]|uniref:tRNA-intron lyase n=1 Tax=Sarocladium strictum TaxID=5046 RepID=A0AA39GAD4_SARSR|nr:hypothetical protein NLU13_9576 [Sarocladium strictum]
MDPKPDANAAANGKAPQQRGPPLHQIYALPAPIKTFPLPAFYPNNPISILHIAYAWLGQIFRPPPTEPSVVHHAIWSETTTSVHVTDGTSVRALWEQGFYGKGSLSRSEPNWLKREQVRRGLEQAHVSELQTLQRREERARAKWERARLEQEAIRQTRQEEAERKAAQAAAALATAQRHAANPSTTSAPLPPVGPLELLALPNSGASATESRVTTDICLSGGLLPPIGPLELLALPNSSSDVFSPKKKSCQQDSAPDALAVLPSSEMEELKHKDVNVDGLLEPSIPSHSLMEPSLDDGAGTSTELAEYSEISTMPTTPNGSTDSKDSRRRKSVRFSPKVESTTFGLTDPPSPKHTSSPPIAQSSPSGLATVELTQDSPLEDIVNREHLQLMPEEAFFLSFGLGVLKVSDPLSGLPLSTDELLRLFRQHSYFPPRWGPDEPDLEPDDDFLLHYVVYHHFRSLGWVPRAGIKFGVDWLLYTRGPVFDHAEFGIVIIPSYTHPYWEGSEKRLKRKTWQWFHSVLRVLSHVMKSVVLVYVDVPPPETFEANLQKGIARALGTYKIREVMIKRWSSNRNR